MGWEKIQYFWPKYLPMLSVCLFVCLLVGWVEYLFAFLRFECVCKWDWFILSFENIQDEFLFWNICFTITKCWGVRNDLNPNKKFNSWLGRDIMKKWTIKMIWWGRRVSLQRIFSLLLGLESERFFHAAAKYFHKFWDTFPSLI